MSLYLKAQDSWDVEVLSFQTSIQLNNDKLTKDTKYTIQVNNRSGEYLTDIYIPYSKGDKVSIDESYITDIDGNIIRKIGKNEISDRSSISGMSLYEDDFVKSFSMKHNKYPYQIVYSYKITYKNFLQIASIDFNRCIYPIRKGTITLDRNIGDIIKEKYNNAITKSTSTTDSNRVVETWSFSYTPKSKINNIEGIDPDAPKITIVPLNFKYGKDGSFSSWNTFGEWLYNLNLGKDNLTESEKTKIDELISDITDKKEIAKILYQYMQDYHRYINVSIGLGGMQTYSAEYVCTNRYGDCKALTNYTKSILEYAGIESFYTPINMDDRIEFVDPNFASQAFNHVILTIPFGADTTYLECTSKTLPFGYVHSSIQGRKALLVDKGNSHLIEIPKMQPNDVLINRNIDIKENSIVKVSETLRGEDYEILESTIRNKKTKDIESFIVRNCLPNFLTYTTSSNNLDRNNNWIQLDIEARNNNSYKKYGNSLQLSSISNYLPKYEVPESRTQDMQIDYPIYYKDTIVYDLGEYQIAKLPENINYESNFGSFNANYKSHDSKVILEKSILIKSGYYSIKEYPSFYQLIKTITDYQSKNIYIDIK